MVSTVFNNVAQSAGTLLRTAHNNPSKDNSQVTGIISDSISTGENTCTQEIRDKIVKLRETSIEKKAQARVELISFGVLAGITACFGTPIAPIGAIVIAGLGLWTAGESYSAGWKAEEKASLLEKTYHC